MKYWRLYEALINIFCMIIFNKHRGIEISPLDTLLLIVIKEAGIHELQSK